MLVRAQRSGKPEVFDAHHSRLRKELASMFDAMQLDGVMYCRASNLVVGSFYDEQFELRQIARLPTFYRSQHSAPSRLTIPKI